MDANTILIVDDNETLREGLKALLEQGAYDVLSAGDGREALKIMEANLPDLILSDIIMPVMDGYEFFQAVRARSEWVSIPIIFLTARRDREDVFIGKKLGAEDYLIKPVNRGELIRTVRSRLTRKGQLDFAQMQQGYESSLIMLASAVEARDQLPAEHVEQVLAFTLILAKYLELTSTQQNQLRFGAILHDIGKIFITEHVLKKTGPLDDAEWNELKNHSTMGAEMLKDAPMLGFAIPVIRHHHERWDGSGYPDGLSGNEIPLGARIVAVADSFAVLVTNRVYRPAFSRQDAYEELINRAGSQYDPRVISAFQRSWDAGEIEGVLDKLASK
jgi:putative two-component system response regulator